MYFVNTCIHRHGGQIYIHNTITIKNVFRIYERYFIDSNREKLERSKEIILSTPIRPSFTHFLGMCECVYVYVCMYVYVLENLEYIFLKELFLMIKDENNRSR